MATTLFKVRRTSGANDFVYPAVAPAPGNGTVVVGSEDSSSGHVQVARFDSSGAPVWRLRISAEPAVSDGYSYAYVYTNSTRVLVAISASQTSLHYLDMADGAEIWRTRLPIRNTDPAAGISPDGTRVVVAAYDSFDGRMVSLSATTGAKQWEFDLRAGICTSKPRALGFFSNNDILVCGGTNLDDDAAVIYRVTSAGALVWGRLVAPEIPYSGRATVGVDPSDNVYVVHEAPQNLVSGQVAPLSFIKLDSSGNLLWGRTVTRPGALSPKPWRNTWTTPLVATADGVYLACALTSGTVPDGSGHVFVPAAGTVGAGVAKVAHYNAPGTANPVPVAHTAGSQILMAYWDAEVETTPPYYAVIVRSDNTSFVDDSNFGPLYVRTSHEHDVSAATVSVTNIPTRSPNLVPIADPDTQTTTYAAGDLVADTFVASTICNATSVAPTTSFGAAYVFGVQLPYTKTTAFGSAHRSGRGVAAQGSAFAQSFGTPVARPSFRAFPYTVSTQLGTPALSLNRTVLATSVESALTFQTPFAINLPPAPPRYARSIAPTTALGRPAVAASRTSVASGASTTSFGAAVVALSLPASSLASSLAFGAAASVFRGRATGFRVSAFGGGKVAVVTYSTSFSVGALGRPRAAPRAVCTASGFAPLTFGSTLSSGRNRTRSAKFRTTFGNALVMRAEP